MYLMVQNPGVAPVEGYLLLGVSTTRDCGVSGTIGQFGSGAKHAINTLLRAGLAVTIYCGKTKLDFQTRDDVIDDGLVKKPIKRVYCKMGGTSTRTVDTGWVLDFGALDWTNLAMALREFVSNAIDRTIREKGDFVPAILSEDLRVALVDEPRARDGYTRVYIQVNEDVQRYYGELPRRFLHFASDPSQVKKSILPKTNRNIGDGQTAMIYREGVLVREVGECKKRSLFDYNFRAAELHIDESRNSSEYEVKAACSRLMAGADSSLLAAVFKSLTDGEETFEAELDPYYICPSWQTPKPEQKKAWQQAWQATAGDAVLVRDVGQGDFVQRKGLPAAVVKAPGWAEVAERFELPTAKRLLSENEQKGREILPATEYAQHAVDMVWGWLEGLNLTNGKVKPPVGGFRDIMNAGSRLLGFCDDTGVYLADDHASGMSKTLVKTALEECVHWCTKATDCSRDFQDFLLRLVVEIAL